MRCRQGRVAPPCDTWREQLSGDQDIVRLPGHIFDEAYMLSGESEFRVRSDHCELSRFIPGTDGVLLPWRDYLGDLDSAKAIPVLQELGVRRGMMVEVEALRADSETQWDE